MTEARRRDEREGVVTAFDRQSGLGTVRDADGGEAAFHCIEIADGSRDIPVGTAVRYRTIAKLGRWEAADLRPA